MISYTGAQLPEAARLAGANAFVVSLDRDSGERLVCGNVLDLRCLTDESASQYLQSQGWLPQDAARPLVMVEYEIWVTAADWSPQDPEHLVYRRDRIFAETDNLVNNELLTHGMGPELNVIEYENLDGLSGSLLEVHFPDQCLELLCNTIKAAHEDGIIDHFRDGGEIPNGLSGPVNALYRECLVTVQASVQVEEEEMEERLARKVAHRKSKP